VPNLRSTIATLPKVLLHDHLDGGLRPETVLELAGAVGHQLPADEPDALAHWFATTASSGSLPVYLTTFDHTIAVLQSADALARAARECVVDLAKDGVVYVETKIAPEQHLRAGLSLDDVVEAVCDGLRAGEREAAETDRTIRAGLLVTAMRHADQGREIAEVTVRHRDAGVVGFDIAGAEAGFPPTRMADAFDLLREQLVHITVHAGEAAGPESVAQALAVGAERIGHGVRLVEDVSTPVAGSGDGTWALGRVAQAVLDRQIPLETCPSSNAQTGAVTSLADHPFDDLRRHGFNVSVSTDNRLMSATSMTQELQLLVDQYGYGLEELEDLTTRALEAGFLPFQERRELLTAVVAPGFARARDALGG
jgi:adenosine deaminase